MAFLNKKEDVLDIELTQYGKYLLSQGRFKPSLYAFFDDDILYDGAYGGLTEAQSNIEYRIKNQTPSQNIQYVYKGVETAVKEVNKIIRNKKKKQGGEPAYLYKYEQEAEDGEEKILPLPEDSYATFSPIGTSDVASSKSPAWLIRTLDGDLTGSVEFVSGAHSSEVIPQLSASIEYEIIHKHKMTPNDQFLREQRVVLEDGSVVIVNKKPFLLQIEEINTTCTNENFDIEVFLIDETSNNFTKAAAAVSEKKLVSQQTKFPLYWPGEISVNKAETSYNFIATSEGIPEIELGTNHTNYYLNVFIDDRVDVEALCDVKQVDDVTCLFPTADLFECADLDEKLSKQAVVKDTYKQVVEEIEECD